MELPDYEAAAESQEPLRLESQLRQQLQVQAKAIPTMRPRADFLSEPSLDSQPALPCNGAATAGSCHAPGRPVGQLVRVRNDRTGSEVDAVVVDSIGDRVKLFYQLDGRCFTQVVSSCMIREVLPVSGDTDRGATVMVKSATVNTWFKGTVVQSEGDLVTVHWRHNGRLCAKVLCRNSPDLRFLTAPGTLEDVQEEDKSEEESDVEEGEESEEDKKSTVDQPNTPFASEQPNTPFASESYQSESFPSDIFGERFPSETSTRISRLSTGSRKALDEGSGGEQVHVSTCEGV